MWHTSLSLLCVERPQMRRGGYTTAPEYQRKALCRFLREKDLKPAIKLKPERRRASASKELPRK